MTKLDEDCYWNVRVTFPQRVKNTFGDYSLFQGIDSILDWGCSHANTTEEIFNHVKAPTKVFGIDRKLSPLVVEEANNESNKRLTLVSGDGFSYFQERGKKFNLVLCMNNVLYVMNEQNREKVMNSLGQLVEKDGKLILATSYGTWSADKFKRGAYVILKEKNSKFVCEDFHESGLLQGDYPLEFFLRHKKLYNKSKKNLDYFQGNY